MMIQEIETEEQYNWALQEIDKVWNAEPGTAEDDRLNELVNMVVAYEEEKFPFYLVN